MNLAGYALRPPRGPKDAMSPRQRNKSGIDMSSKVKKEMKP